MWATGCKAPASGKVESVLVDMEVPSAAAAGAVAADEEGTFLLVPRNMLRGASSQLHLSVRIDKA
jgi:E3 ubiquitin-protein ligase SIAH1